MNTEDYRTGLDAHGNPVVLGRVYITAIGRGFFLVKPTAIHTNNLVSCEIIFTTEFADRSDNELLFTADSLRVPDPAFLGRKFLDFSQALQAYTEGIEKS